MRWLAGYSYAWIANAVIWAAVALLLIGTIMHPHGFELVGWIILTVGGFALLLWGLGRGP